MLLIVSEEDVLRDLSELLDAIICWQIAEWRKGFEKGTEGLMACLS